MGAYSSFPSFSLAHHFLLHICEQELGCTIQYYLLGDDIVIKGTSAATAYSRIIEDFGMEKQDTKSVLSMHGWEFAKRFIIEGNDFSPYPIAQMFEASKQY
jgi:hypothetical protein